MIIVTITMLLTSSDNYAMRKSFQERLFWKCKSI